MTFVLLTRPHVSVTTRLAIEGQGWGKTVRRVDLREKVGQNFEVFQNKGSAPPNAVVRLGTIGREHGDKKTDNTRSEGWLPKVIQPRSYKYTSYSVFYILYLILIFYYSVCLYDNKINNLTNGADNILSKRHPWICYITLCFIMDSSIVTSLSRHFFLFSWLFPRRSSFNSLLIQ